MTNLKNYLKIIVWLLSLASFIYIIFKLYNYNSLYSSIIEVNINAYNILIFILVIILMPFNWITEALKWKILTSKLQFMPFKLSIIGVLSGLSSAMISPNRTGEFIGRVAVVDREHTGKAIFLSFFGSLSQVFVTVFFGCFGLFYLYNNILINYSYKYALILVLFSCASLLVVLFLLLRFKDTFSYFKRFSVFRKYINIEIPFLHLIELFKIVFLSFVRYIIFLVQFMLCLYLFSVNLSILQIFACISSVYLIMALVPSFTLAELGLRGAVAIIIFGFYDCNPLSVLAASSLLWVINLAIPSVVGTILFTKYLSTLSYDKY